MFYEKNEKEEDEYLGTDRGSTDNRINAISLFTNNNRRDGRKEIREFALILHWVSHCIHIYLFLLLISNGIQ